MSTPYKHGFVPVFQPRAEVFLALHDGLEVRWDQEAGADGYAFWVKGTPGLGFDVGVGVEAYGLYPRAGEHWRGAPWELPPRGTTFAEICDRVLDFVRVLLSPDARMRVLYARRTPYLWIVEFASPKGWLIESETRQGMWRSWLALGSHSRSERIFQNTVLPPVGLASGVERTEAGLCSRYRG